MKSMQHNDLNYRSADADDINGMKILAARSWAQFEQELSEEHWNKLNSSLVNENMYLSLIGQAAGFVCVQSDERIAGMAFLVPNGNPTEIYDKDWCYIRMVSVDPGCSGMGIGRRLTELCIKQARKNGETTIALHTSEMMAAARHIYEKLGFRILKEIEPRFGKRYWLYTLAL